MPPTAWPPLPLAEWRGTCETLHRWTQVAGKVCLALAPPANHFWNTTFRVTARGLRTPTVFCRGTAIEMLFDLISHQFQVVTSEGAVETVRLQPRSVADFYRAAMAAIWKAGVDVRIWPVAVEIPDPLPFEKDIGHADYDPVFAAAFLRVLLDAARVLEMFRAGFVGKASPVHFFWGGFDLAATRFSGRRAPERQAADRVTREAYSHEVISHGFWPGSGAYPEAAFYAYAAPAPEGLEKAPVSPGTAFYHRELGEFILPYDAVRTSGDPDGTLLEFLHSTYRAAADLAGWDRATLERQVTDAR
jgi:hypothetical protein